MEVLVNAVRFDCEKTDYLAWRDVEGVKLGFGAWKNGNFNYNEYIMYVVIIGSDRSNV